MPNFWCVGFTVLENGWRHALISVIIMYMICGCSCLTQRKYSKCRYHLWLWTIFAWSPLVIRNVMQANEQGCQKWSGTVSPSAATHGISMQTLKEGMLPVTCSAGKLNGWLGRGRTLTFTSNCPQFPCSLSSTETQWAFQWDELKSWMFILADICLYLMMFLTWRMTWNRMLQPQLKFCVQFSLQKWLHFVHVDRNTHKSFSSFTETKS